MSLAQLQMIRDRLSKDACGVGSVVSADTMFYMMKSASSDLGVNDKALWKLLAKIDDNGDNVIQFSERGPVRRS